MVLDVLQPCFGDVVTVRGFLFRVAKKTKPQAEVCEPSEVAPSHRARRIEGAVLPCAVGVGGAQYFLWALKLLRHLNDRQRLTRPCIEAAPIRLNCCNLRLRELI